MAKIYECPEEISKKEENNSVKLFLAGGISNSRNWQHEVINMLKNLDHLSIFNPRRKNFDLLNKELIKQQIEWEYKYLQSADIISFWFTKETLNPITLYELGKWGNSSEKEIVIGIEPGYLRKEDVIIQTLLARPDINVFHSEIGSFCNHIIKKHKEMMKL